MTDILIALGIGIIAGTVDILPMLRNKIIPRFSIIAIFVQWVFIGLVIPFISWNIQPWLIGIIIGTFGMLPFVVIAYFRNRKSIYKILLSAASLGAIIGLISDYFIG